MLHFFSSVYKAEAACFLVCAFPLSPDGSAFAETPEYGYCNPAINLLPSYLAWRRYVAFSEM